MKNVFPADCEKQCSRWHVAFSSFAFSLVLRHGKMPEITPAAASQGQCRSLWNPL